MTNYAIIYMVMIASLVLGAGIALAVCLVDRNANRRDK